MQSKIGNSDERYSANLLIKMLQAISPHFKPVLQEILVWAAPQTEVNVLACLGKTEGKNKSKVMHFIQVSMKKSILSVLAISILRLVPEMVCCNIEPSISWIRHTKIKS